MPLNRREMLIGGGGLLVGLAVGAPVALETARKLIETASKASGQESQPTATTVPATATAVRSTETVRPTETRAPATATPDTRVSTAGLRVDVPRSLDDPDMRSYSLDDRAPKGVWYHPLHQPELWVAPRWDGAWSWGVSLMNNSDGAHVESHGDPGRVVVQVDEGKDRATLVVGAMTSDSYQGKNPANDYKWGTRGGRRVQNTDWAIGMWIRTQPGAEIALYDPDSGQPLMKGDKQATVTANDRGDAGVILPNKGRVVARWNVTDPTKGTFESIVWFGPDDDPQSDQRINKVDVRAEARK